MKIPLVDLKQQYQSLRSEIDGAIRRVIEEAAFIGGDVVTAFEREFAAACRVEYCVGVGNGTDALTLILRAMGIGAGDRVLVPANTFIATAEAVTAVGATPLFVDCNPDSYNISVEDARRILAGNRDQNIRAIIPVHLYGRAADLAEIGELADEFKLRVIEDAAQAHLAEYRGQRVGGLSDAAAFSFYPAKNLGAYGDGGAVLTDDAELAQQVRMLSNHGRLSRNEHLIAGGSSRLDAIQAAILRVKLKHLPEWNLRRHDHALKYNELLSDLDKIITPEIPNDSWHVFHLYVIRVKADRTLLQAGLAAKGISTQIHYPEPLPALPPYRNLSGSLAQFPVATACSSEILSLPLFPELTVEQINYIVDSIREVLSQL